MSGEREVRIRLKGSGVSFDDAVNAGVATRDLLRALNKEVLGDADAVDWRITNIRFVCDGCGVERPDDHTGWINKGGEDFCPCCQGRA